MSKLVSAMLNNPTGRVFLDIFDWYPSYLPVKERKLLRKLDLSILVFACLSFFCKFLDQSNITNAYVSGMKEDIKAYGNDLNYFNVAFFTAYVVGQIPMMWFQTKPRLAPYFLPTLEMVWAVLTFCQSTVTNPKHVYILRALIGFFESPSFGGTHLILGSWYREEELFKRAGVWFMGNSLGSMFSGYLQAAAYKNLNGVRGLAGWRWLFIIDGVITLPIAFVGYALFPGLPNSPKRWFFSEEEYELASTRLQNEHGKGGTDNGITWQTVKTTLRRPMWYICVFAYICMINSSYWVGYMSLWLKHEKYPITLVNVYPTFVNLIQALSSWLGTTLAKSLDLRGLWTFQWVATSFAAICLSIWTIPVSLKFVAFYLGGITGMSSPILYSWINSTLRHSTAERGLIISSMMTFGYSTYIWVPLFTFPTVEAPRFPHGYPASVVFNFALWASVMGGIWYMRREPEITDVEQSSETSSPDSVSEKTDLSPTIVPVPLVLRSS
ncbi:major facilitator superfamily domain-containing protein [Kockovaella imperatae]|uniref:Major facilitator superfamily domain-containing protein n=1 Tax=Kockovaella imperatae TaxID=4999 RepID=A0A1Y1UF30_9TREE|nr:major facilitator superfamily domain-containing protein [Kockovaella imperatae]ORX36124.1 major facilitator superfamily domain-containing protein [Kockovaella imperatae]